MSIDTNIQVWYNKGKKEIFLQTKKTETSLREESVKHFRLSDGTKYAEYTYNAWGKLQQIRYYPEPRAFSRKDLKMVMTQGVAATKQISNKGFIKSAKYYFSQTNTLFYRPLVTDAANDIQNAIISRSVNKGATFWTSFWG